jgi:hypothetical protein
MFPGLGALDYPIYPYSSPTTGFIVRSSNVSHSTDNETDGGHVLEDDGRRKRRQSSARDKDSLSQIHSVCTEHNLVPRGVHVLNERNRDGERKTARPRERSVIGKRST